MNDEKPSEPKVGGRPFDGGLGPTAQSVHGVPIGRPQLDAQQIHGEDSRPSWRPPRQGLGTGSWIAIIVAAGAAVLVVFWALGVI